MPSIPQNTQNALTDILKSAGDALPAPAFVVGSADGILYSGSEGRIDILDPSSAKPHEDTVYAFYSTTKLITSVSNGVNLADSSLPSSLWSTLGDWP